ncbi:MAG: hypothetical protein OXR66_08830 [Candidatus Woesearchaeota archaeon]|nr:hypothetical protein [Candidatus Woesearchaeota archaeon]
MKGLAPIALATLVGCAPPQTPQEQHSSFFMYNNEVHRIDDLDGDMKADCVYRVLPSFHVDDYVVLYREGYRCALQHNVSKQHMPDDLRVFLSKYLQQDPQSEEALQREVGNFFNEKKKRKDIGERSHNQEKDTRAQKYKERKFKYFRSGERKQ